MNMATDVMEEMISEFLVLETELTIFELRLLFRAAAKLDAGHIMEPIGLRLAENPQEMLARAPFLTESTLLEMAQQQRLYRLGLIVMGEDQTFLLTDKGVEAVKWWWGGIQDIWKGM